MHIAVGLSVGSGVDGAGLTDGIGVAVGTSEGRKVVVGAGVWHDWNGPLMPSSSAIM